MKHFRPVLLLCVLCLLFGVCAFAAAAEENTPFVPVVRFIASSDTHVKGDDDVNMLRIGKMLDLAYSIAESDEQYQKLDALLVAGDLTNNGTQEEFERFWNAVSTGLRGDTKYLGVVAKNHDGWTVGREELHAMYSALTGATPDFHTVVNGYHFIGLSVSADKKHHYDKAQKQWLKEQLDAAVAEDPNKPVFVMHHEHNRGTVYGSSLYDGWGITHLKGILKKYPQVVDISGHSHYPLNDPRSIWQKEFTAIGTGAIYYAEVTTAGIRAYDPPDCKEVGTFWLVELDAQHNMHLRGYDVEAKEMLCEYTIKNPADPANRDYTPKKLKAAAVAPAFALDAELKVSPEFGKCTVQAPLARSVDGTPVVLYRAKAKNRFGYTVAKDWVLPSYYRAEMPDTVEFELDTLGAGTYSVTVTAETAYGVKSKPLETIVTVEGKKGFAHFFESVKKGFISTKEFFRQLFS